MGACAGTLQAVNGAVETWSPVQYRIERYGGGLKLVMVGSFNFRILSPWVHSRLAPKESLWYFIVPAIVRSYSQPSRLLEASVGGVYGSVKDGGA